MDYRAEEVFEAVCELVPKSEQLGRDVLLDAYVNMGHAEKCATATHQYIDGRRGTGKTHLLGFLAESINSEIHDELECAVYIDTRDLAIESGEPAGPKATARDMYRELILKIADALRKIASRELWQNDVPTSRSDWEIRIAKRSHQAIDTLYRAAILGVERPVELGKAKSIATDQSATEAGASIGIGFSSSPPESTATAKGIWSWLQKSEHKTEAQSSTLRRVSSPFKV